MYREPKKLNSPQINDSMRKWANEVNRALSKEEVQMAKNHIKKYSSSLAIKEMKIKVIVRFYLTPSIKNTTNNVHEDVQKKEHSYTAGRDVN
jgi:uncharacterized protein YoxC